MGYGAHMDKLYFEVKSYFRYKKTVVPDWVNPPLNSLFFFCRKLDEFGSLVKRKVNYCWWFRNPANQLRLVVYPMFWIFFRVSSHSNQMQPGQIPTRKHLSGSSPLQRIPWRYAAGESEVALTRRSFRDLGGMVVVVLLERSTILMVFTRKDGDFHGFLSVSGRVYCWWFGRVYTPKMTLHLTLGIGICYFSNINCWVIYTLVN